MPKPVERFWPFQRRLYRRAWSRFISHAWLEVIGLVAGFILTAASMWLTTSSVQASVLSGVALPLVLLFAVFLFFACREPFLLASEQDRAIAALSRRQNVKDRVLSYRQCFQSILDSAMETGSITSALETYQIPFMRLLKHETVAGNIEPLLGGIRESEVELLLDWKSLAVELERRHPGELPRVGDLARLRQYQNYDPEDGSVEVANPDAWKGLVPFSIRVVELIAEHHVLPHPRGR